MLGGMYLASTSLGVYKLDINQGNYVTQDQVDKLQGRPDPHQVRAALGTPLVTDAFHANRWDYIYEFNRQGSTLEHRQFTVYFVDDKLARWEGDEVPPSRLAGRPRRRRRRAPRQVADRRAQDRRGELAAAFLRKLGWWTVSTA